MKKRERLVKPGRYGSQDALSLVLGTRLGSGKEVVLAGREAMAHKFIAGTTGVGKSSLVASLALQLINQGVGVMVLDPHSDLVEDILALLADTGYFSQPEAFQRVRYIAFKGDKGRHIPFNVHRQSHLDPYETARFVWNTCLRAWPDLVGGSTPLMQQVMLSGSLALCAAGRPLTELSRLLTDASFRAQVLPSVQDAQVRGFFAQFDDPGRRSGGGGGMLGESALRRAFLLSFTPALRQTLGQIENTLDLFTLMQQGVSVLADLGGLDEESQRMLGCLLTVGAETAALARADLPEEVRRPYALILDEWSMFADQSEVALERMLALVRKFGVSVTLACQTLGQARKLHSALQNTTPIVFRLGELDADWGAARVGEYEPEQVKTTARGSPVYVSRSEQQAAWADRLQTLPPRYALVRLGTETIPFYTLGLPARRCTRAQLAAIKERYAALYLRAPQEASTALETALGPAQSPVGGPTRGPTRPARPARPSDAGEVTTTTPTAHPAIRAIRATPDSSAVPSPVPPQVGHAQHPRRTQRRVWIDDGPDRDHPDRQA